jgi:hypothetical protein
MPGFFQLQNSIINRMRPSRKITSILLAIVLLAACTPDRQPAHPTVITHPDGPLYVGDQVSFEVISGTMDMNGKSVQVSEGDQPLGSAGFGGYGVGARNEAVFWWTWDTRDLQPGRYTLTFATLPDGPAWTETYILKPAASVPPPEPDAHWTSTTSVCCTIYYITGTDAARDIETLKQTVDAQAADVEQVFGADFNAPVNISFLSRTLGHGGFTTDTIYVSYLDLNYAGSTTSQVIHHEMVHLLDGQLGGEFKPTMLVEGLAVYLSGGHFKKEPILPRAAALLDLGWYVPLHTLTDDFYPQQHEVGYLEAAALVQYLVDKYGWSAFDNFYRHMQASTDGKQSDALDAALKDNFIISLDGLESEFILFLKSQTITAANRDDLRLTVRFYDTVRRYQQGLDPSAYFMTAWLPDGKTMRDRGIVTDYLRHPTGPENRLLESWLVRADKELRAGEYEQASKTLDWIERILSATGH